VKIAFVGNQNNNHFAIVRYLRDLGYDAELLLFAGALDHFHPRCDTYDLDYMNYTKQLSWGMEKQLLSVKSSEIDEDLSPYEVICGTGFAPAYLAKSSRTLDVFDPFGSDIYGTTFYRLCSPHYQARHTASVYWQRRGIREVRILHSIRLNETYEKQVSKYARDIPRWTEAMPMVYAPQYDKESLESLSSKTHWGHVFRTIRKNADLMLVFGARNNFHEEKNPARKGVDILLRGYSQFVKKNKSVSSKLVLFEYGNHVIEAKRLADELGLSDHVQWLPQMYRKDLVVGLKLADICFGQFGVSWIQNGTLFEALVAGKPIITWRDERLYDEYEKLYPIFNANTPDGIASSIEKFLGDPISGREMGRAGREWYEKTVVGGALEKYCRYFDERA